MDETKKQPIKAAGFVILPRLDFEYKKDEKIYQWLVINANYRDEPGCTRGQILTTYTKLSEEFEWSYDIIRGIFKRLQDARLIEWWNIKGKRGFLVTVRGYERMQNLGSYKPEALAKKDESPGSKSPSDKLVPLKWVNIFFQAFGRMPNSFQEQDILAFMNDGLPDEVICAAFEKTGKLGKPFNFARTMLVSWAQGNVKTLEEAIIEMEKHDSRNGSKNERGQPKPNAPPEKQKEYEKKYGW